MLARFRCIARSATVLLVLAAGVATAAFDARGVLVPLLGAEHLAVGSAFTCASLGPGQVYCWGNNLYRQIGNDSEYPSVDPQRITGLPDAPISALSAGGGHACALVAGEAWCWGYNQYGQLGDNGTTDRSVATRVQQLGGVATQISAGDFHTCAVVGNSIKCWGNNFYGQLGSGDESDQPLPHTVPGLGGSAIRISAGSLHTCAVVDGATWCWGNNLSGQLGNGQTASAQYLPTSVTLPGSVADISTGSTHTCARIPSGAVFCWGNNTFGQLGLGTQQAQLLPSVVDNLPWPALSIATATQTTCARTAADVYCWGDGNLGQIGSIGPTPNPRAVPGVGAAVDVGMRNAHGCARKADGSMLCWGLNTNGQLGDGSAHVRTSFVALDGNFGNATLIAAGTNHTCATFDGGVKCWGYNGQGQLGRGTLTTNESLPAPTTIITTRPTSLSAGIDHTCAVVAGRLYCWGVNQKGQLGTNQVTSRREPTAVPGFASGVTQVAAGDRHTCALRDGGVWCWGYNGNGELGDGTAIDRLQPVAVSGLASGVTYIEAGANHTCAIQNGAAKCWGLNTDGQLGIGTNDGFRATPQPVATLDSGVTRISPGISHTCAIRNGAATCWGYDGYAALGNGIVNDHQFAPDAVSGFDSGVSEIAAGDDISCAVRAGSVWCWGADYSGDLGNGGNVRNLRALPSAVIGMAGVAAGPLAIGGTHACAATTAGSLRCWGDDFVGSLGIGRVVISYGPLPVVRQDRLFADGLD
jgi:alpha-tubulin suppressor-like RCC1 family protein